MAVAGSCPVCLLDGALADGGGAGGEAEFRYDVLDEIARGGMGVVYRAVQHGSQRTVALKMILADLAATGGMAERFRAEAEAVASLDHPNILPIYETGEYEGRPFYSMKLADGGALHEHAARYKEPAAAARLIAQVAHAVHHAHQRGILHRDLKPGNILLDGPDATPYVTDFGIAKWIGRESALTLFPTALGSPQYVAPEQAAGASAELTTAADIYSLGAILYELLAGRPPFLGGTALETLRLASDTALTPLREIAVAVPRDLEVVCLKCLARESAARYDSAAALAEDLERWLAGRSIVARPVTRAESTWRWAKRNPTPAALSGALVLAVLALAVGSTIAAARLSVSNRRALAAEKDATEKLYGSYLDQARASRLAGNRSDSLAAAGKATQIHRSREARDATIAALTLVGVQPGASWSRRATLSMNGGFDSQLERYAVEEKMGEISVRRVSDQSEIIRLTGPESPLGIIHDFSRDGRYLAAKFLDGTSWIWDLTTGQAVATLQGDPAWTNGDAVFTPDGSLLAFSRAGGGVAFYRLDGSVDPLAPDWAWEDAPRCHQLAFDPTGERLAMADAGDGLVSGDRTGAMQIRGVQAAAPTVDLRRAPGFSNVSWSPDGTLVAASSHDHQLYLHDAATGAVRAVLRGHLGGVNEAQFSHDGAILATSGFDNMVRLWDVASGTQLCTAAGSDVRLEFSTDDRRLGISFPDGSMGWLDVARVEILRTLIPAGNQNRPFALAASSDGRLLASAGDGFIHLWDAKTGAALALPNSAVHDGGRVSVSFAANSRTLFASSRKLGLSLWRLTENTDGSFAVGPREPLALHADPECFLTETSADGKQLAVSYLEKNFVSLLSIDPSAPARVDLRGHPHAFQVALSPDGKWAASGARLKGGVRVWDLRSGEAVCDLEPGEDAFVAFSPDSRWLLTATGLGYQFWDAATWKRGPRIEPETSARHLSFAVAFDPRGEFLAVQQNSDRIALYDARSLTLLANLETPRLARLEFLRFTGDGQQLAALGVGQIIQLWDIPALRQQLRTRGLDWSED